MALKSRIYSPGPTDIERNGSLQHDFAGLTKEEATKISDDDIWKVISLQIDFGTRLADGLDTKIGYGGIDLSGGQNKD